MMPPELFNSIFRASWYTSLTSAAGPVDLAAPASVSHKHVPTAKPGMRPLEDLSQEVVHLLAEPCDIDRMIQMSTHLRQQFHEKLRSSNACMLPSFCHTLPSGQEKGTFVAMDVGGSTLRVALVELGTRHGSGPPVTIRRMSVSKIEEDIRKLPSAEFFDWMAQNISMMLQEEPGFSFSQHTSLPIGLAWSFPIEQTSNKGGKIQGMGKGFACGHGCIGQDLGSLIEQACQRAGFAVRVEAVINDSSAVLLSQAYANPATSMGLITGTGVNAAAFLPVSCMGREKFGSRDQTWFKRAEKVITNTELSMFGKGILPETRWDTLLNHNHQLPDFQPLEYMTTGRYLGEILRLIIVEAVETCGFLDGRLPQVLNEQYTLDTALLAAIEADDSPYLSHSAKQFKTSLDLTRTPSNYEMAFLRAIIEAISHRAAAFLSVAIHALWSLQKETEINLTTPAGTPKTSIACNGTVILKYPGFRSRCEKYVERMAFVSGGGGIFRTEQIVLQPTHEAAIVGAAVAVAVADYS